MGGDGRPWQALRNTTRGQLKAALDHYANEAYSITPSQSKIHKPLTTRLKAEGTSLLISISGDGRSRYAN